MPLSDASPRTHQHTRRITLEGHLREDGLIDVDAEIADYKTYAFTTMDRTVQIGDPLHRMLARITVNEDLLITHAEAVTEFGPFDLCGGGAETFARLAGLEVKPGFLRAAAERLGGVNGCTHLRELLQQMATVAMQTLFPLRAAREAAQDPNAPPRLLNSCHAYDSKRSVIARRWPQFYTGG